MSFSVSESHVFFTAFFLVSWLLSPFFKGMRTICSCATYLSKHQVFLKQSGPNAHQTSVPICLCGSDRRAVLALAQSISAIRYSDTPGQRKMSATWLFSISLKCAYNIYLKCRFIYREQSVRIWFVTVASVWCLRQFSVSITVNLGVPLMNEYTAIKSWC